MYDTDPVICVNPKCKSSEVYADYFETGDKEAWREVVCQDCGTSWKEVYAFVRIDDVEIKSKQKSAKNE